MSDLSAEEMCSYANAMSERIVELQAENEHLRKSNQQDSDELFDALRDEIERLQSRVDAMEGARDERCRDCNSENIGIAPAPPANVRLQYFCFDCDLQYLSTVKESSYA